MRIRKTIFGRQKLLSPPLFWYNAADNTELLLLRDMSGNSNNGTWASNITYRSKKYTTSSPYTYYNHFIKYTCPISLGELFCDAFNFFTITAIYNLDTGGNDVGARGVIFRYGTGTDSDCNLCLYYEGVASGKHKLMINVRGTVTQIWSTSNNGGGSPYFVRISWNGSILLVRYRSTDFIIPVGTNPKIIGLNLEGGINFKGEIDEISGYNYGMTISELNRLSIQLDLASNVIR